MAKLIKIEMNNNIYNLILNELNRSVFRIDIENQRKCL